MPNQKPSYKQCPEGCAQKQIAFYLSGDPDDLDARLKHHSENIEGHSMECRMGFGECLSEAARKGDTDALIFWLCCFGGWGKATHE